MILNIILRELNPRQVDKTSRVPKEEKGVWGSQGGPIQQCSLYDQGLLLESSAVISKG